ncbi:MAG: HIT family protein [Dysgonamonadaceae bacterium]|jgi:histidine triad (HIT) family protein|nr:HIT family protein [Dysgonamonadaceae bacterium]
MTIFSKIIAGEIPSYKVAENAGFYAFLDINPLVKGHTLVVPKKEVDYIYDLDERTVGEIFVFSKQVAIAIQKAIPCKRVGIAVIGMEVPHAHIHLIPLNRESDMIFSNPKLKLTSEEFRSIASAIAASFEIEPNPSGFQ